MVLNNLINIRLFRASKISAITMHYSSCFEGRLICDLDI